MFEKNNEFLRAIASHLRELADKIEAHAGDEFDFPIKTEWTRGAREVYPDPDGWRRFEPESASSFTIYFGRPL